MATMGGDPTALSMMEVLILIPPVIGVLTLVSVALLLAIWRRRYWRWPRLIYHTALVVAATSFTWFLYNWNLLTSA